jgi:hypothetical protein
MIKRPWRIEEINYLKNSYPNNSTYKIASELKRSYRSIQCKALRLGLDKEKEYLKNINKGRKHIFTEEHKKKIGLSQIGRKSWNKGQNKYTNSSIKKQSHSITGIMAGKKHPFWRGGITPLKERLRKTIQYVEWRRTVFERDNYQCQKCGQREVDIEAHHIKPFIYYPKLWFKVSNGLTLCKGCHRKEKKNSPNFLVKVPKDYFYKYLEKWA